MQITVEAVSDKYANKFSSGSVKTDGKWLQVAKNVDISLFKSDTQIDVETKTNDKGYTSIVGVGTIETAPVAEKPKRAKKIIDDFTGTALHELKTEPKVTSYEDNKNLRILVQGIVQACVQAPGLVSLSITNVDELAEATEALATRLIAFVDKQIS